MKHRRSAEKLLVVAAVALIGMPLLALADSDGFLPQAHAPSRYTATWSSSPFEREILPPPPAAPAVNPFDGFSVAGYFKVGEKYRVTLVDKKNQKKFVTSDPADSEDGMHVIKVTRNGTQPSATMVTLRRGTEEADVGYDSKRVGAAPKGLPIQKAPAQPGNRAAAANSQARGAPPNPASSAYRGGAVLPRNTQQNAAAPQAAPAQPAQAQPAAQQNTQAQAANQQLIEHLRAAAQRSNTQGATNNNNNSSRPQRRRVVLPPTVGNR
ncbi:MAG: hypothetical protein AAGA58_02475 [Verrucomicrobiota bacterium]